MARRFVFLVALASGSWLHADDQTRKLADRLSEEAAAFQKIATQMIGEEKLHQSALKPPPRFRPRIGNSAKEPPQPIWQNRDIESQYAFAAFQGEQNAIHELRQVLTVDGKPIQDSKRAQDTLAKAILADNDDRKKQLLKDFERHGLVGAVTDFGQIILLFSSRDIAKYEFSYSRTAVRGGSNMLVFNYKQIDGPEALTLIDGRKNDRASHLRIQGEVWVWQASFQPVRVTMSVTQGEGGDAVRQDAWVDYQMSNYGALLPSRTEHREMRGGKMVTQNEFVYSNFKKFAASSDIKFEVQDPASK